MQLPRKWELCRRIGELHKRFEILRTEQDRFDFNYFTASPKPVKVFGKPHTNYHVAVQKSLFGTARNVFYDAFSERLSSNATEQEVESIDAAYVKRITDDFCAATNLVLETAAADLDWLFTALGTEVGQCNKRESSASTKPTRSAWPPLRGWAFRSGEASYNGQKFDISGKKWQLLQAFVEAEEPLTYDDLIVVAWPQAGDESDRVTIRANLSQLRSLLRTKLHLKENFNPLPRHDCGDLAAWELNSDLR